MNNSMSTDVFVAAGRAAADVQKGSARQATVRHLTVGSARIRKWKWTRECSLSRTGSGAGGRGV